jgi:hypothetical protein
VMMTIKRRGRILFLLTAGVLAVPTVAVASSALHDEQHPTDHSHLEEPSDELATRLSISGACSSLSEAINSGDTDRVASLLNASDIAIYRIADAQLEGISCQSGGRIDDQKIIALGLNTVLSDGRYLTFNFVSSETSKQFLEDFELARADSQDLGFAGPGTAVKVTESIIVTSGKDLANLATVHGLVDSERALPTDVASRMLVDLGAIVSSAQRGGAPTLVEIGPNGDLVEVKR